jgi:hypothetical protein
LDERRKLTIQIRSGSLAVGPGARAIAQGFKNIDPIATMTLAGPETGLDFFRSADVVMVTAPPSS